MLSLLLVGHDLYNSWFSAPPSPPASWKSMENETPALPFTVQVWHSFADALCAMWASYTLVGHGEKERAGPKTGWLKDSVPAGFIRWFTLRGVFSHHYPPPLPPPWDGFIVSYRWKTSCLIRAPSIINPVQKASSDLLGKNGNPALLKLGWRWCSPQKISLCICIHSALSMPRRYVEGCALQDFFCFFLQRDCPPSTRLSFASGGRVVYNAGIISAFWV